MEERYTTLYALPKNLYLHGSPVVISAGALLKDNKTGSVLVQLKLRNIQRKCIKAVTVQIVSFDTAGRQLETKKDFQYLDLMANRDTEFGQKVPIALPDTAARTFSARVAEVVFDDLATWTADSNQWEPLPLRKTIQNHQLAHQLQLKYGAQYTDFFQVYQDLWYCSCGAVNKDAEAACHSCGRQASVLAAIDWDELKAEMDERLREETSLQEEQTAQEALKEKKKKKRRRIMAISSICVMIIIVAVVLVKTRQAAYNEAVHLMDSKKYADAIAIFTELGDYQDSILQVEQIEQILTQRKNTYKAKRASISAGFRHSIGLHSDGTVVATGLNSMWQCNVSTWSGIVAVAADDLHTVGLCSDGTVVATGSISSGQCDVSTWSDIVAVAAGNQHTVGLRSDGTVVATGSNNDGQCDVSTWSYIVAIAAGSYHTVGLRSDATVIATGENRYGPCDVSTWIDIVAVEAGSQHTVGLCSDGTVVATGRTDYEQCDVSTWLDIVAVAAGGQHTVGLRSDGTVVATGRNNDGECDVSTWSDIVAVAAGGHHTVGLRSDGTVVATGENDSGQCNVSDWSNIKLPDSQQ